MGRTESISFQVHPAHEQEQIDLMQKFRWSLLGTQEVRTSDSHLETRTNIFGEKELLSVTESAHYVKLSFSRDLGDPGLPAVKKLEQEFFALPRADRPSLFPGTILLWLFIWPFWPVYLFLSYKPKAAAAAELDRQTDRRRREIIEELERMG